MKTPENYKSTHLVPYERPDDIGFGEIEVLSFLKGRKWDEVALAYVHALRPSSIRVTTGICKLDARIWRVTVYVDKNDIIQEIGQEVEVGLPDGVEHADALEDAFKYGLDSEQVKWHQDAEGYFLDGVYGGYYKQTKKGLVPFPGEKG